MIATITNNGKNYVAQFNCPYNYSVAKVWSALTDNDKLSKWMSNLEIFDLKKGGMIKFNYNDGSSQYDKLTITDFEQYKVLEFEWGMETVRFELVEKDHGCLLILKEFIIEITDHTPKDLAGWHICLDLLNSLLDNQLKDFSFSDWEKQFKEYQEIVKDCS